jgi:hypothetical protein
MNVSVAHLEPAGLLTRRQLTKVAPMLRWKDTGYRKFTATDERGTFVVKRPKYSRVWVASFKYSFVNARWYLVAGQWNQCCATLEEAKAWCESREVQS